MSEIDLGNGERLVVAPVNSSGWRVEPGRSVAEVEAAGAVEGFLRGAGREATGQDGLLVVVVAGAVDGEAPAGGGSGVAESAERQGGAVGELAGDVGELAVVADGDAGELGPALACPGGQALAQRGLGRLRWPCHMAIVPYPPGRTMERMPSGPYGICLDDAGRAELESLSGRASAPFLLG